MAPAPRPAPWRPALLLSALLVALPQSALALPFDPLPSAFQRWLNARRDWPAGESLVFRELAQCSDQTQSSSPYRTPVFTCLKGTVLITSKGQAIRTCRLQRVSYFPTQKRVRYWTQACS